MAEGGVSYKHPHNVQSGQNKADKARLVPNGDSSDISIDKKQIEERPSSVDHIRKESSHIESCGSEVRGHPGSGSTIQKQDDNQHKDLGASATKCGITSSPMTNHMDNMISVNKGNCRLRDKPKGHTLPSGVCMRKPLNESKITATYKRRSMYVESLSSHDLTGRASLMSRDLVFNTPPAPVQPPRLPQDDDRLQKSKSTPNMNKRCHDSQKVGDRKTSRAADILNAMKRLSVTPSESGASDSDSDDCYMEWSDGETSVESPSSPSHKEEPYENMEFKLKNATPKDKAHRVALELVTTEETYVRKLDILNKARDKTSTILGDDVAKAMFPYISSIYVLHKDNMLPHLKERLFMWDSQRQIGDIMKTFAPYLKLYTDYVKNFDAALKLVDTWNTKNAEFAKMLKSIPSINNGPSVNLKLQIKSHMLEPIQRVPRYQLLLQQYSREIKEDSPERADLQVALRSVSQAALHFEEMMKRGNMVGELVGLQRQIESPISLMSTGRYLVKQGKIGKVNATTGKVVSRYIFLFNDLLLICSEQTFYIPGVQPKYKVRQFMEVDGLHIAHGDNLDVPFTFYVKTRKKAVELCAVDAEEKADWEQIVWKVVGDKMRLKISQSNTLNRRRTMMMRADGGPLGKEAPVWVHNSQVTMCTTCAASFRGLKKKHHCRACGTVVCNKCSSHTAQLEYDDYTEHRVCDECYLVLEEQTHLQRRDSFYKSRTRQLCIQNGYLHVSSDGGKNWQRRWFEVHEGGVLYCYRAQQDVCPMTHVNGCVPELCALHGPRDNVIRLQIGNKCYLLKEENEEKLTRWLEALKSGT